MKKLKTIELNYLGTRMTKLEYFVLGLLILLILTAFASALLYKANIESYNFKICDNRNYCYHLNEYTLEDNCVKFTSNIHSNVKICGNYSIIEKLVR